MMLDAVNHKNILIRILKDIYTDPKIGPFLGFKGGTAAYLFYDLNRFSVDLDFDLVDLSKEEDVFNQIKEILKKYGTIKENYTKRYTLFFRLSYIENQENIKIEINLRNFGSRYEIKQYLGISMKVMIKEDMVAHKMVAMIERIGKANRDIFDTNFFLKNNWPINEHIIEIRTGKSMPQFLKECIEKLESMSNVGILNGLGELLNPKQKDDVKKNLRTDTIFLLKLKLENLPATPQASVHSYKKGNNLLDPSGIGSQFYKEYSSGGIYDKSITPAKVIINFDQPCSDTFLDKFLYAAYEKIKENIIENSADKKIMKRKLNDLKISKKGQTIHLSTYETKEQLQKIIIELNNHFKNLNQ